MSASSTPSTSSTSARIAAPEEGPVLATGPALTSASSTSSTPSVLVTGGISGAGEMIRMPNATEVEAIDPNAHLPQRRIAIVGYTSSRDDAPIGDPSWECWGMNNLHQFMDADKFGRWYDLHPAEEIAKDPQHVGWLREWTRCPVVLMDKFEGVTQAPDGSDMPSLAERSGYPAAVPFPRRAVEEMFGTYFTNTVSWQIAQALWEGLTRNDHVLTTIGLFGVDMAVGTEYASQRPSVEFFLGLAKGLGVDIVIPHTSDLLKTAAVYGASDDSGFAAKMGVRHDELQQRRVEIEAQMAQLQSAHSATCGAIDTIRYIRAVWLPPQAGSDNRDTVRDADALTDIGNQLVSAEHRDRHAKQE